MAQPWARAETLPKLRSSSKTASRHVVLKNFIPLLPHPLYTQIPHSICVGKEEEIHDDKTCHHGKRQQPAHQRALELQVHEVADNQRRLDHRKNDQYIQHAHWRKYLL